MRQKIYKKHKTQLLVDAKQLIAIKDDFNLIKLHILHTKPLRCSKQCHVVNFFNNFTCLSQLLEKSENSVSLRFIIFLSGLSCRSHTISVTVHFLISTTSHAAD